MATHVWGNTYPVLSEWVGTRSDHPFLLHHVASPVLSQMESLLSLVTRAKPAGWEGRRRLFRAATKDQEIWSIRTELLTAGTLLQAGIEVEFRDRPDVVAAGELGFEVTARFTDGSEGLAEDLAALESRITRLVGEKAHQALDVPTFLVLDVSQAGSTWLRPPQIWAARLLDLHPTFAPFIGVVVGRSSYDEVGFVETAVALVDEGPLPACWSSIRQAFDWNSVARAEAGELDDRR